MAFHVFGHIETNQLDAHDQCELTSHFGLADACRAGKQEGTDRLALVGQPGSCHLDRRAQRLDRFILSEDRQLQIALERFKHVFVGCRHTLRWDARHFGNNVFDHFHGDAIAALGYRPQAQAGARLIDHIDRLVRQPTIIDMLGRQFRRNLKRLGIVFHAVMFLETALETAQDSDCLLDAWLWNVDFLKAARQRMIFFEDATVFGISRRSDAANLTVGKHRLDQV